MFCVTGDELIWTQDLIALAQQLHLLLERLLVPYYVNADIVVSASTPFDESKMSRRLLLDENFWIVSPEDLILAKLLWGKGQSEKQLRDVLGVLKIQGKRLDFVYLERWAVILELETLLSRAVREAGI